jgi:Lipase (class 3)
LEGALAMLAAGRMYFEDPKLLANGVYTFGQPRTCDRLFAKAYDTALKSRAFRFVSILKALDSIEQGQYHLRLPPLDLPEFEAIFRWKREV